MLLFLKNLLFTLVIPGTVGVYAPYWIGSRMQGVALGPLRYASVIPFALGVMFYLWCVWDFATVGRGTPFPADAPKKLVVRGLYRYVRNPMYVGVLLVISGWCVYFASPWLCGYLLAVFLMFSTMVVLYEEPVLERLFGEEYRAYRSQVGRWWPRLPQAK